MEPLVFTEATESKDTLTVEPSNVLFLHRANACGAFAKKLSRIVMSRSSSKRKVNQAS